MMRLWMVVIALGAGGCMPMKEDPVPTREDPRFTCNARPVQNMIGQVATNQLGEEAVQASGARTMRWIAPDTAVTMDYRTDRLNLHLDRQNRITRIVCG